MLGVFVLFVQPEFSEKPLESDKDVSNWLRFYDISAPLICLSELVSHDPVSFFLTIAL